MHESSPELHKKQKSSSDKPAVSGMIESGKEAGKNTTEIGADRIGVSPKDAMIAEKAKQAAALRKTWKVKFEEFKNLKKELDEEQTTMLRLKLAGKLSLSEADMEDAKRSGREKLEAAGRDAENYKRDAEDLEAEIAEAERRDQAS
jgi:hypothetical protein